MREIKFRAWDKTEKGYYTAPESVFFENSPQGIYSARFINTLGDEIDVRGDNLIFEQFTGLHDLQGKEIYEGDIVSFDDDIGVIKYGGYWEYCGFGIVTNKPLYGNDAPETWDALSPEWSKSIAIIGNIHENQELLK